MPSVDHGIVSFFWAVFFGLLGLNNMLGLAAFGRWAGAAAREQTARAEIRAAMRWPSRDFRFWILDFGLAPADTTLDNLKSKIQNLKFLTWHLPHAAGFVTALALPATLLGLFL